MTRIVVLLAALLAAAAAVQGSQATFTASATNATSSFATKANFPPPVTITSPVAGTTTGDSTPTLSGAAGSNSGDSSTVNVKIYSGATTAGTVVQTKAVTRSGATWTWTPTTALASGTYTAQATQTDASQTGTSAAVTFTVDATKPTAVSVVAANKAGGTPGKIEAGDTITFTYSEPITAASVWSTWGGSSTSVKVRFSGTGNDSFTVLDMSSNATINLGTVATNGDYTSNNPNTFTSTMVRSADGASIVVTLGTPTNVRNTANVGRNMSWTVGAGITDLYGNTIATPATYNQTDTGVDF